MKMLILMKFGCQLQPIKKHKNLYSINMVSLQRVPSFFGDETKGIGSYYQSKVEELEVMIRDKSENLERLRAQRNELNSQGISFWIHNKI